MQMHRMKQVVKMIVNSEPYRDIYYLLKKGKRPTIDICLMELFMRDMRRMRVAERLEEGKKSSPPKNLRLAQKRLLQETLSRNIQTLRKILALHIPRCNRCKVVAT